MNKIKMYGRVVGQGKLVINSAQLLYLPSLLQCTELKVGVSSRRCVGISCLVNNAVYLDQDTHPFNAPIRCVLLFSPSGWTNQRNRWQRGDGSVVYWRGEMIDEGSRPSPVLSQYNYPGIWPPRLPLPSLSSHAALLYTVVSYVSGHWGCIRQSSDKLRSGHMFGFNSRYISCWVILKRYSIISIH